MDLYPLSFVPKLSPKIWGSESWEIYDRPEGSAVVAEGQLKGASLQQLMKEWGPRLLGPREFEKGHERFPLMIKRIDAKDALSVQVHPDDDQALRLVGPSELGKTEMWLVLEAQPGAKVVAGLKSGTGKAEFLAALKAGKLEGLLQEFEVKPGDCIYLPAGRVHAIGKGCLIAEVQQNSDTTYRVYDYQRLENGKARELHINQALECIRFDPEMEALPGIQAPGPLDCPYFHVETLRPQAKLALKGPQTSFQILMGISGQAKLQHSAGSQTIKPGDCLLIPASVEASLEPLASAELLWVRP